MGTLAIDALLTQVKAVAVKKVSVGVLRAAAHLAKQAAGERFQQFATKVRGLITDCDYVNPCPHAPVPNPGQMQAMVCGAVNCAGSDYAQSILRNILLAGVYDTDIKRSILGAVGIERKPIQDIIELVEVKEAARNAAGTTRPAAAAASTLLYKNNRSSGKLPPPPRQRPAATTDGDRRPRKIRCGCGNDFEDYVSRRDGSFNSLPYNSCRTCYLNLNRRA